MGERVVCVLLCRVMPGVVRGDMWCGTGRYVVWYGAMCGVPRGVACPVVWCSMGRGDYISHACQLRSNHSNR